MTATVDQLLARARQLLEGGNPAEAAAACHGVLEADVDNVAALAMLAQAGKLDDDLAVANFALCRLAELVPDQPEVFQALGETRAQLEDTPGAITAFERCLELDPDNAKALRGLGNARAREGQSELAADLMRRALRINPRDTAAHYQLTTLSRATGDDPRLEPLQALFAETGFSNRERSRLAFAIARILDQQARYDDAFRWFSRANELRRKEQPFDVAAEAAWIKRAIATFDADLLAERTLGGHPDPTPVFIVGMPRSGSSLLEQVLASHSQVHGGGELMLLPDTLRQLSAYLEPGTPLPEGAAQLPAHAWQDLGETYCEQLRNLAPAATRIVDKQLFNYTLVGFIARMLPNARILHASRHPMATCWSCFATAFRQDRGFTNDFGDLGETWQLYRRLMDHWQALLPDQVLEIRYENLLDDLEGSTRRVLDFLELEWEPACLEFYKTRRTVNTASKTQVRQPLYSASRDHWRHYEGHLEALRQAMETRDSQP